MSRDRGRIVAAAALLAGCAIAFGIAREHWHLPVGRPFIGFVISEAGLAVQLAALVAGVLAVHLLPAALARVVLVTEGAICLAAFGPIGLLSLAVLLAWCAVMATRWRGRFLAAAAIVAAVEATALSADLAPAGLLFAMLFVPRMLVAGYDRWQHRSEATPIGDLLLYMLPAPLVVFPPYLTFLPMYGGFGTKLVPGMPRERLVRILRHAALAAVFGGAMVGLHAVGEPVLYGKLLRLVLEFAAFAHLVMALLVMHGIELAPPLDRPLAATRYTELWSRFASHQRDAQVFLFYTPALLRLRRRGKVVATVGAALWTLVVGSTLLHLLARYAWEPDAVLVARMAIANVLMGVVLAIDLLLPAPRHRWLGWAVTLTLAAAIDLL